MIAATVSLSLLVVVAGAPALVARVSPGSGAAAPPVDRAEVLEAYGRLPLSFEANEGQTDPEARFLARTAAGTLFLTPTGGVLAGPEGALRLRLDGANPTPALEAVEPRPGQVNYLRGADHAGWQIGVRSYGQVRYRGVYPGVDLVWHGTRGALEYDFVVAPGADPGVIAVVAEGASGSRVEGNGDLVTTVGGAEVRQRRPEIYQDIDGRRRPVPGAFALGEGHRVGFEVGPYDAAAPLVIDPLVYSTFLGGTTGDDAQGVAVDSAGNAYIAGNTSSADFPVTAGAFQPTRRGNSGAFVTKLNPTGTALVYSTHLGGSAGATATGLAVDASGNAYVAGSTRSTDFPVTAGAFQATHAGETDGYVAKLNTDGSGLLYSSYLGGSGGDTVDAALAIDASGNAYVAGRTISTDFPTTPGAFRAASAGNNEVFVAKLATTSGSNYSTYLGGSGPDDGRGIAVDSSGHAYVTGSTGSSDFPTTDGAFQTAQPGTSNAAFVAKLNASGSGLAYSTYLGGPNVASGAAIAVDGAGSAYVTGVAGLDHPTTPGAFQTAKPNLPSVNQTAYVSKLNPAGSALAYSTWLAGTNGSDSPTSVRVDPSGRAHVAVNANSTTFPLKNPIQATKMGGFYDPAVAVLNPTGSELAFSTYLGGSQGDQVLGLAIDGSANVFVVGATLSNDFPITPGVVQQTHTVGDDQNNDAFVAKISTGGMQPPVITGSTWYSDGSNVKSGGAGTEVRAYAVGAFENLPYLLVLATSGCTNQVAVLNPNTRFANSSGFLSTTVGTIPAGLQPGPYVICFRSTTGDPPTATGTVGFTVS